MLRQEGAPGYRFLLDVTGLPLALAGLALLH